MFVIDFNKEFAPMPGDEVEKKPTYLNQVLAFSLSRVERAADPIKVWDWAMKASADGILEVDAADKKLLYELVRESTVLMVAAKAQLMKNIDAVKEEK
jgi:hypothetical protein